MALLRHGIMRAVVQVLRMRRLKEKAQVEPSVGTVLQGPVVKLERWPSLFRGAIRREARLIQSASPTEYQSASQSKGCSHRKDVRLTGPWERPKLPWNLPRRPWFHGLAGLLLWGG